MKKIIIVLLALMPLTQAAELVADLRLDGNFTDSKGNLTFSNNDDRYNDKSNWLTSTAVRDSSKYVSVGGNAAAWNGSFKTVDEVSTAPNTTNFAITLFLNASDFPVSNHAEHPDWTTQWIIGGGSSPNNGIKLGLGHDGQIKTGLHNVGEAGVNSGSITLQTNQWYQVGLSVTNDAETGGSVWTLFINGAVAATNTQVDRTISFSNIALFEGADHTNSGRFTGYVDDIQFYSVSDLADAKSVMTAQAARLIPEPTTATLSLLALCGLAARRRRR